MSTYNKSIFNLNHPKLSQFKIILLLDLGPLTLMISELVNTRCPWKKISMPSTKWLGTQILFGL